MGDSVTDFLVQFEINILNDTFIVEIFNFVIENVFYRTQKNDITKISS